MYIFSPTIALCMPAGGRGGLEATRAGCVAPIRFLTAMTPGSDWLRDTTAVGWGGREGEDVTVWVESSRSVTKPKGGFMDRYDPGNTKSKFGLAGDGRRGLRNKTVLSGNHLRTCKYNRIMYLHHRFPFEIPKPPPP